MLMVYSTIIVKSLTYRLDPDLTGTTSGQLEQIPRLQKRCQATPPVPLQAPSLRLPLDVPSIYGSFLCYIGPSNMRGGPHARAPRRLVWTPSGLRKGGGHWPSPWRSCWYTPSFSICSCGRSSGSRNNAPGSLIAGVPNLRMSLPTLRANVTSRKSHQRWTCQWSAQPAFLDRGRKVRWSTWASSLTVSFAPSPMVAMVSASTSPR